MDIEILNQNKELELLLTQYISTNQSYLNNLNANNADGAQSDLNLLNNLNTMILALIVQSTGNVYGNYQSGIDRQTEIQNNNIIMQQLTDSLNKERVKIKKMLETANKLDGSKEFTKLNVNSYKYHYLYFFLSAAILLFLIFKAFMTKEEGPIDTVIIVSAILLAIYSVWQWLYNYFVHP
jgi:hypothetical protein